jgi:hypothetical protein
VSSDEISVNVMLMVLMGLNSYQLLLHRVKLSSCYGTEQFIIDIIFNWKSVLLTMHERRIFILIRIFIYKMLDVL